MSVKWISIGEDAWALVSKENNTYWYADLWWHSDDNVWCVEVRGDEEVKTFGTRDEARDYAEKAV